MPQATWTKEDYHRAEQKLEQLSQETKRPLTVENLLERWTDFISDVERGYDGGIDDYTGELSVRDLLEQVREVVTPAGQAHLDRSLRPLDERFEQATHAVEKPLQPAKAGAWWSRVPHKSGDQLRQALGRR
jgi:hypothetical protein